MRTMTYYWSSDRCAGMARTGRVGARFDRIGGGWNAVSSFGGARPGDRVLFVHVSKGLIYLLADLVVTEMIRRYEQIAEWPAELGPGDPLPYRENEAWPKGVERNASQAMLGTGEAPLSFGRIVPPDWLSDWQFISPKKQTRPLKFVEDGRLKRTVPLAGFFQLAPSTGDRLTSLFEGQPVGEAAQALLSEDDTLRRLELSLAADPTSEEGAAVYADALLERGDPRGEIMLHEQAMLTAEPARSLRHPKIRAMKTLIREELPTVAGLPGGFPFRLSWGPKLYG